MASSRVLSRLLALPLGLIALLSAGCGGGASGGGGMAMQTPPPSPAPYVAQSCARPAAGAAVMEPPALYSQNGVLKVALNYVTSTDDAGRALYCFITSDGLESPTLHLRPGDTLEITLTNRLPAPSSSAAGQMTMGVGSDVCGAATGDASSVNIHFHGTNTAPSCHSDETIHTTVNAGQTFTYSVRLPRDEPPGLYWYHPHIHGLSDAAVEGGASGAIVVDGIENLQPAVGGLPTRTLVIRDQNVAGFVGSSRRHGAAAKVGSAAIAQNSTRGQLAQPPSWDVTLNYVPIAYPQSTPAVIGTPAGRQEFWRVLNASADTIADLDLQYDGVSQTLKVVALDGVPTGSQDGTGQGVAVPVTHIVIPPAGRAEFIVTTPAAGVQSAVLLTHAIDTGPAGDVDTTRTLATLQASAAAVAAQGSMCMAPMPQPSGAPPGNRFAGLTPRMVTANRKLYFSETVTPGGDPETSTQFFITVDGAAPTAFSAANPPAIVTRQGAVEQWTIENRSQEVHAFHIHQIHFKVIAVNGQPVPDGQQQFYDTYLVPYWTGSGPYPSITVLMDFRGPVVGDFVYHCHILDHEDNGMMAIIRVLPRR